MATTKKQARPAGGTGEGLKVIARAPQGIRRAGRHWPAETTTVALADLTEDQLELLEKEPGLVVTRCQLDADGNAVA